MRIASIVLAAALGVVVVHDMGAESCNRWYRVPLQLGCDLALPHLPFGNPLYELAYGTSDSQEIYGFYLSDPWSYRDPRPDRESTWTDLQSGTFSIIEPLNLILVLPPPWLDKHEFMKSFSVVNPSAVPVFASSKPPQFVLVQVGGGVEGIRAQVLLDETGRVTGWRRRGRRSDGTDSLQLVQETEMPRHLALELFELAADQPTQSGARVYWNCRMLDGGVRSLSTSDGNTLARSHWVNNRWPSASARKVFETLLEAGVPQDEGLY